MKIVDAIQARIAEGKKFFSFEFFPPRTEEGVENLFDRLDTMAAYGPVFCDITWGAGGSTADVTLDIAVRMQSIVGVETMMHLTCTNMPEEKLQSALLEVRKHGIQNILALRGDPPKGQEKFEQVQGGFACALDLVRYIRQEHGDYFGICVAGYPEAHPDVIVEDADQMDKSYWADIAYLKQKVDAGGEFIITQLFYDVEVFLKFVTDCRSVGITVPIIPGIMPIMTYGGFTRMTGFCKTRVPAEVKEMVESIKDNDEAVKAYGVDLAVRMCRRLLDAGTPGVHLYTLNLDKSPLAICQQLGFIDVSRVPRPLPWSHVPAGTHRVVEGVRPLFWALRPHSYAKRTHAWSDFPRNSWSNHSPLAALTDPKFLARHSSTEARKGKARAAWGAEVALVQDVQRVFQQHASGQIALLPWSELSSAPVQPTSEHQAQVQQLIQAGLLVIHSQPAINGAPSATPAFGWGPVGGFCYQKAFYEFFVSPEQHAGILAKIQAVPGLTFFSASAKGDSLSNLPPGAVETVTWGVFPGREVLQPNVVDTDSWQVWREEAFQLWSTEWASLYEEGSTSQQLLSGIRDTWHLVAVVDEVYVHDRSLSALLGL